MTMGLFDGISNMISNVMGGATTGPMANEFMGVLQQHGVDGVSGLVSQFEQSGLGAHVASWVGEGENLPISADQVQQALGSPAIASIAAKFGVDPAQASQMISEHLPAIMSHLTPGGQIPAGAPPTSDAVVDSAVDPSVDVNDPNG
jgi:uncharacterized protein YidB (DUF937 family)